MDSQRKISLFRSAHWMLLGLALALGVSFWVGSAKFGKKTEDTYLDPHRLAALKTFEPAIEFAFEHRRCSRGEIGEFAHEVGVDFVYEVLGAEVEVVDACGKFACVVVA